MKDENKITTLACLELILLRSGTAYYHQVVNKLASYDLQISDCIEQSEKLRKILKEVYGDSYNEIVSELRAELSEWASGEEIEEFLKILER